VRAVELVHEDPGETDPADTELGQARERGSARPHDVDRALDAPDELTNRLIVGEPDRKNAIGASPRIRLSPPTGRSRHALSCSPTTTGGAAKGSPEATACRERAAVVPAKRPDQVR
jgi:hypothetical protein